MFLRLGDGADEARRIARPTGAEHVGYGLAGEPADAIDHLLDTVPDAGAEIEGMRRCCSAILAT